MQTFVENELPPLASQMLYQSDNGTIIQFRKLLPNENANIY